MFCTIPQIVLPFLLHGNWKALLQVLRDSSYVPQHTKRQGMKIFTGHAQKNIVQKLLKESSGDTFHSFTVMNFTIDNVQQIS